MHSRLTDEKAACLAQVAASVDGSILLDSGDAIRAGNITVSPWGEPILGRMTELGYAAMALGNREFHVFPRWFASKTADAGFPILCANLRPDGEWPDGVERSIVVERGKARVGILGVTTPLVREGSLPRRLSAFGFADPIESAQEEAARLREGCDLVVALTHVLEEAGRAIARLPGVDLVLAGHTHGGAIETQPGAVYIEGGRHAQRATWVSVDLESREVVARICPLGEGEVAKGGRR